ncbi:hypothetical protein SAMN05444412_106111 [Rhodonellum ikkaensis]|nr:hypothetical protein SAMN05444412_106111 [Rhodonellum ikkaensis]
MIHLSMDLEKTKTFLLEILKMNAEPKSLDWLALQKEKIGEDTSYMKFYLAFGMASRYFKKNLMDLSETKIQKAKTLVEGFSPESWDQLQTARSYLLLHFGIADASAWVDAINKLFETADMHEQQSLYAALPLMPFREEMVERAVEGLRTNIASVFDAIALDNPYPSQYMEERAWNQMVLKAVFMQRPLYRIQGADKRANPTLAKILVDFAHERWAAGRKVMPELWRFVGPYLDIQNFGDIEKVIHSSDPLEKNAALLACHQSGFVPANSLLKQFPKVQREIQQGELTWEKIGREFENLSRPQ